MLKFAISIFVGYPGAILIHGIAELRNRTSEPPPQPESQITKSPSPSELPDTLYEPLSAFLHSSDAYFTAYVHGKYEAALVYLQVAFDELRQIESRRNPAPTTYIDSINTAPYDLLSRHHEFLLTQYHLSAAQLFYLQHHTAVATSTLIQSSADFLRSEKSAPARDVLPPYSSIEDKLKDVDSYQIYNMNEKSRYALAHLLCADEHIVKAKQECKRDGDEHRQQVLRGIVEDCYLLRARIYISLEAWDRARDFLTKTIEIIGENAKEDAFCSEFPLPVTGTDSRPSIPEPHTHSQRRSLEESRIKESQDQQERLRISKQCLDEVLQMLDIDTVPSRFPSPSLTDQSKDLPSEKTEPSISVDSQTTSSIEEDNAEATGESGRFPTLH